MFAYYVCCQFAEGRDDVAKQWLNWLKSEHIDDVISAGATSADVVRLDDPHLGYEIRYLFDSRSAFEQYESHHAPRLREEGLRKFPLHLGLQYSRRTGEMVLQTT